MSSSSGAGGANHNQSWVSGVTHATTQQFRLHETIFATSLGVQADDEYFAELTECAAELLYSLPSGWTLSIGENELSGIPIFTDTVFELFLWFCGFVCWLLSVSCQLSAVSYEL